MEIIIHRSDNNDLLRQNRSKLKLQNRRNILICLLYASMGIFFLVINWVTLRKEENFWSFTTSFGISLILLSLFYFIHLYKNGLKYMAQTKQLINRHNKQKQKTEVKITDTMIIYKDFERYIELKWTLFTQYKLYKEYLFLIIDANNLDSIIINRNEISKDMYHELFEFVKKKFPGRA